MRERERLKWRVMGRRGNNRPGDGSGIILLGCIFIFSV